MRKHECEKINSLNGNKSKNCGIGNRGKKLLPLSQFFCFSCLCSVLADRDYVIQIKSQNLVVNKVDEKNESVFNVLSRVGGGGAQLHQIQIQITNILF